MNVRESAFMNELESAIREKPYRPALVLLGAMAAFVTVFIIWASLARIEEIARGQGQVVPSREIQVVQSLEGGILQELLVSEGDRVTKGQVLLRISDVQFSSEERGTEARSLALRAKKARLRAEADGTAFTPSQEIIEKAPKVAANEKALFESRQKELATSYSILDERINKAAADLEEVKAEINRLASSRSGLNKELSITRDMVAKRAVPKLEQIRLERELSDINGQIAARSKEKEGLDADLAAVKNERQSQTDKFRSNALSELSEVETQVAALDESLKSIGDRVDRTEIRAPVDGLVNAIRLKTVGGVIEPAMKLVEIVPVDDELKIIARVQPSDVAFLHKGQSVKVKITAYDSQIYGALDGELTRIAANSTSDQDGNIMFEIEVKTEKNHLGEASRPLPITPGMVAEVNVVTGRRTIMYYLLKPLRRTMDRALIER
ncbi:MAG: HlyD family type I secretion periplasmic adaptor subunit [Alphaproteobacteria bacterium]|nr:HlyD family type I secretion periplasmic adaptor subunit [Alphaproteobacteria bacterium]MCB9974254.1 HlyD family type I secretion periplasmic adaptor subunit [Rhodospirillales bacterium]